MSTGEGRKNAKPAGRVGGGAVARLKAEVAGLQAQLEATRLALAEAERLADQDPLAPVANRRAFMRELGRMQAFSQRHQMATSLIYLDINGFKQINESLGHAGGDAALNHVVALLLANVRQSDVLGRLGGDEFGVILSGASLVLAVDKSDHLCRAISDTPFIWQGENIRLGIAAGAADVLGASTPEQVIRAADQAMFAHKRQQRGLFDQ
jgi:diguanylate cyclase (GGDEF)-like protein